MSNRLNLTLDVTKTEIQNPLIKLRQGDGNWETLRVTVTSNGEPLDLQGWTVTFMGTTAGQHKIVDAKTTMVEAPNGIFDYTPSKAWGMDIGEFKIAYFKFVNGDGSASSANFRVVVDEAVDMTNEEAKDYISIVDGVIAEAKEHVETEFAEVNSNATELFDKSTYLLSEANTVASSATATITSAESQANARFDEIENDLKAGSYAKTAADNTFTETNTFEKPIVGSLDTRLAAFTDFAVVAKNMTAYSGNWYVGDNEIANDPLGGTMTWYNVSVIKGNGEETGTIIVTRFATNQAYSATVDGGNIVGWKLLADDTAIVHKTDDETIAGKKTFSVMPIFPGDNSTVIEDTYTRITVVKIRGNVSLGIAVKSTTPNNTGYYIDLPAWANANPAYGKMWIYMTNNPGAGNWNISTRLNDGANGTVRIGFNASVPVGYAYTTYSV